MPSRRDLIGGWRRLTTRNNTNNNNNSNNNSNNNHMSRPISYNHSTLSSSSLSTFGEIDQNDNNTIYHQQQELVSSGRNHHHQHRENDKNNNHKNNNNNKNNNNKKKKFNQPTNEKTLLEQQEQEQQRVQAILRRHIDYDKYAAERDPAHALLTKSFGNAFANDYVYNILFPLSQHQSARS